MQKVPMLLEEINDAPNFAETISQEKVIEHFNVDPKEITQFHNREQLHALKKKKKDFNLYEVFKSVQALVDQCTPTVSEFVTRDAETGDYSFTEAANVLGGISQDNQEMLNEMKSLYSEVACKPNELRKSFIKEKVMQNRYTRRGAEYAQQFNDLGEKAFALASLCVSAQTTLAEIVLNTGDTEE